MAFIFKKALIWEDAVKIRNVDNYLMALRSLAITLSFQESIATWVVWVENLIQSRFNP